MTFKPKSFFEMQYYFTILAHGKELYRSFKKIEIFFTWHSFNSNLIKIKTFNKSLVLKFNCKKTVTSKDNFVKYFKNQTIASRKSAEKIFCTIALVKKKKYMGNIYSKFFKLNLFLFKKLNITGFLIHSYSLKYSKLTFDNFSMVSSNLKYTLWDIIIYFIFFEIH